MVHYKGSTALAGLKLEICLLPLPVPTGVFHQTQTL